MSLNGIISSAVSGLQTAQTGLRTVSDNVANVATPGYVRKLVDQTSLVGGGGGGGVTVKQIRLAADRFLEAASYSAKADSAKAGAAANLWDQAQGLFGDPSEDTSFFSSLDQVFSSFSTLSSASTSGVARAAAVRQVSSFFDEASTISDQLQGLQSQADVSLSSDVGQVNQLLTQIDGLNIDITRVKIISDDATGLENQQSQLIDQLSSLMDVKVSQRTQGGVTIRASDGTRLAGDGAASLSYAISAGAGQLTVTSPQGQAQPFDAALTSGAIRGLLDLRNTELPAVATQLSELTSKTADQLNAAHNAYSAIPAPTQLTGRDVGMDLPTAVSGFSGTSTVAVVNAAGQVQRQVAVTFAGTTGTLSVDGAAPTSFTAANFLASLNTALGSYGSASFSGGALSVAASGANGVAVADDATAPSNRGGRSFSGFFGLNDLVQSTTASNYDTGLSASSPHGFTPGGQIALRIRGADGATLSDVTTAVPAASTMGDLLAALNAPVSGVGLYGSFALDPKGQLGFTPKAGSGVSLSVVQDNTANATDGTPLSTFFGIGDQVRAQRTSSFSVRSDILQDPSHLALAKLDLASNPALAAGDLRGADALAQSGQASLSFKTAGLSGAVTSSLSDYAANLSGQVARKASAADSAKTAADAVATEADARRSGVEGVNLDQELVQLTTYQQAYNASARMIQAAKEMYDTLLNMTN